MIDLKNEFKNIKNDNHNIKQELIMNIYIYSSCSLMEQFSDSSKVEQFLGSNKVEVLPWIQQSKMVKKKEKKKEASGKWIEVPQQHQENVD